MIRLNTYILENIASLKQTLIDNINNLTDEDERLIKKLHRLLSKNEYVNINKWLDYAGLSSIKKTIISKLDGLDIIDEMELIYEFHFNDDDTYMISTEELLSNTEGNIYDLILSKVELLDNYLKNKNNTDKKQVNIDKDALIEFATLQMPVNSVAKGPFEILTQLFLCDINKENKGHSDINTKEGALEFKGSGARVMSKNPWPKPNMVYNKVKQLLAEIPSNTKSSSLFVKKSSDEVEKMLDDEEKKINSNINFDNIFAKKELYDKFISNVYDVIPDITDKQLNEIIATSLLEQVDSVSPNINISEFKTTYIEFATKTCQPVKDGKANYTNLNICIFVLHFYSYYEIEKFDKFIIFAKNKTTTGASFTGYYLILDISEPSENNKQFIYLYNSLKTYAGLKNINGFAMTNGKSQTPREWSAGIQYIKK